MPRRSTITLLDPRIKEAIDTLIREDRATIDDIVAAIRALGANISRGAMGRYVKSAGEKMERYREAQEVAKVWIGKLEAEPQGDVARLLPEMLRTVAFQTLSSMDGEVKANDMMLIGRAIESAAKSSKIATEQILKLRREIETRAKTVAKDVEQTARKAGLTAEGAAAIRAQILGIAA